jgi:diguanylate cyclase (GGDEF)-like protein/PAS domain S-box-containing protein
MEGHSQQGSPFRRAALIAIIYAVAAGLWISLSDALLDKMIADPSKITQYQTLKGWGFVVMTSLALYWITLRQMRTIHKQMKRLLEQRTEMGMLSQFRESVIDNASIWINVLDPHAQVTVWNKAAEQISGYSREEVLGNSHIWEWLYPDLDYRTQITTAVVDILDRGREVEGFETQIQTKAGETKIIAWNSQRFFDDQNRVAGSIAIGRDITARKHTEQTLVERERQLATLMANLPGMAYRCLIDNAWTMKFVSNGCYQLTGYYPDDLVDNRTLSYASIIHEEDRPRLMAEVQHALDENRPFATEYRIKHKDGMETWVWEQGQEVHVDDSQYLEGIVIDISQRKTMELELELLAKRDALTGLYTRRELEQQFHEELARAKRYERPLSLLWIDVDHFKSINDRFGHQMGDEVLRQLSQRLQSGIRNIDYAARYGGEELAIILPELDEVKAIEMAERLRKMVQESRMAVDDSDKISVTISVGVAAFPTHGSTPEHLFRVADQAMYRAKQKGRNRVCIAA